jgi:hypothetical protein
MTIRTFGIARRIGVGTRRLVCRACVETLRGG